MCSKINSIEKNVGSHGFRTHNPGLISAVFLMVYTYFWLYWQIDLIFIFVCGKQDILTKEKLKTQSIFIQEFIECTSTYINKLRFIWIGIGT